MTDLSKAVERAGEILADPKRRMDAYCYGFDPTGIEEIDAILSAVASAGKAYHHAESWNDDDYGPSPASIIQAVADLAATALSAKDAELAKAREALEGSRIIISTWVEVTDPHPQAGARVVLAQIDQALGETK